MIRYGSTVLIQGTRIPILKLPEGEPDVVRLYNGALYIREGLTSEKIRIGIADFLAYYAVGIFDEKLKKYAKLMNATYSGWALSDARKRAASCDSMKKIKISWRLIMASDFVIDGVIVHELAHIKHMNHSKDFYAEIEKYLPDYAERQEAMAKEYFTLQCEGWL